MPTKHFIHWLKTLPMYKTSHAPVGDTGSSGRGTGLFFTSYANKLPEVMLWQFRKHSVVYRTGLWHL
jgi:hypothetical protein